MARTVPIAPSPLVGDLYSLLRAGLNVGVPRAVEFVIGESYRLPNGKRGSYICEDRVSGVRGLKFRVELPGCPPATVWQPYDRMTSAVVGAREDDLTERLTITLRDHGKALASLGIDALPACVRRIVSWRTLRDSGDAGDGSRWGTYLHLIHQAVSGITPTSGIVGLRWTKADPVVDVPPEIRRCAAALTTHAGTITEEPLRSFVAITGQLLELIVMELEAALRALADRQRVALRSGDPMKLTAFSRSGLQEVVRAPLVPATVLLRMIRTLRCGRRDWYVADLVEPECGILRIVVRDALAERPLPDIVGIEGLRMEFAEIAQLHGHLTKKRFPDRTLEHIIEACSEVRGDPSPAILRGVPMYQSMLDQHGWSVAALAGTIGVPVPFLRAHLIWLGLVKECGPEDLMAQWEALGQPNWSTFAAASHVDAEDAERRISRAVIERDLARVSRNLDQQLDAYLQDALRQLMPEARTGRHTFPSDSRPLAAALGVHQLTAEYILRHYHLEERWYDLRPTTTREVDRVVESMPTEHRIRELLLRSHGQLAPVAKALRITPETLKRYIGRYGLWRFARHGFSGDE